MGAKFPPKIQDGGKVSHMGAKFPPNAQDGGKVSLMGAKFPPKTQKLLVSSRKDPKQKPPLTAPI